MSSSADMDLTLIVKWLPLRSMMRQQWYRTFYLRWIHILRKGKLNMAEMEDKSKESKGKNGQGFLEQGIFLIICAIISAAVSLWASSYSIGKEIEKMKIEKTAENLQNDKINFQNIIDSCLNYYSDVYFKLKYNKIKQDDILVTANHVIMLPLLSMNLIPIQLKNIKI